MACLNINSLLPKMEQLKLFCFENRIDIMAINETKLDSTVGDEEIHIPSYDTIRKDRTSCGGGVLLFIKSNLNFIVRNDLMLNPLECVIVEITKPRSRPILVGTLYRPPGASMELFEQIESLFCRVDSSNAEFYLLGDINCDLLSDKPHCYTKKLVDLMSTYSLEQVIKEPTRITPDSRTLPDHCITTTPENIVHSGVVRSGVSDHDIIFAVRKLNSTRVNQHNIITKRSFKHFKNQDFLKDLKEAGLEDFQNLNDPDAMWDIWKEKFLNVVNKHAPLKRSRVRNKRSPWITDDIISLIRTRDSLKRKAVINNTLNDWSEYKNARNKTNNKIKQAKTDYFSKSCTEFKDNPRKLWKTINEITSRKAKNNHVKPVDINNETISEPAKLAEAFNVFFSEIGENLGKNFENLNDNIDFCDYLDPTEKRFTIKSTTTSKVFHLLSKLSETKATGLDNISSKLLKISASVISASITVIFNTSISTGIFPDEWKLLG